MVMKISQWQNPDRREGLRASLQLRLAVVYPQRQSGIAPPIYHGTCRDICMSGLSMVVDDNVFQEGEVTVLLALPPVHSWASQTIITATAEMTYAIRSSKLNGFKIGLRFREFKRDGKAQLEAALRRAMRNDSDAGVQSAGAKLKLPPDSQPLNC